MKYKAVIHTEHQERMTLGIDANTMEEAKLQLRDNLRDDYFDQNIYITSAELYETSNPTDITYYAIGWFEALRQYGKPSDVQ